MRSSNDSSEQFAFAQIIEKPLLYLVALSQNEEEANEAARVVAFTAYGRVITGFEGGSIFTAQRMKRDFELKTDDTKWEQVFQDRLRDDPATVLVVPADVIEQISEIKPDPGGVVAVFERKNKLVFEQFI